MGILGCMAERLKERLLDTDRLADIVAGPDAYRDLPRLLSAVQASCRPTPAAPPPQHADTETLHTDRLAQQRGPGRRLAAAAGLRTP